MSFLVLFLPSRCAQPHMFTLGSGPGREPACAPGSHPCTFPTFPEQGDPHKSRHSPLVPYSLTFTHRCLAMLQTKIHLSPLISGSFADASCALSLASATQPCRSHAGIMHNLNVFKPIDLKQQRQQVEKALRFQLEVPDLTTCQRQVQAITENGKLKGKYHSFALWEKQQRALSKYPTAERFAERWGLTSLLPTAAWDLQGGGTGQPRYPPAHHSPCFRSRTERDKVRQHLSKCP